MTRGLRELGEFGVVDLFAAAVKKGPHTHLGIGDDCAVLKVDDQRSLLISTDLLGQGVHFDVQTLSPAQLGHKSLTVNVSDVAAMGGEPFGCTLTLSLWPDTSVEAVESFRDGFLACAREHGVELLGGDTTKARNDLTVGVTLLGWAKTDEVVYRSGARPGDLVVVSGPLGDSAAGLRLLQRYGKRVQAPAFRDSPAWRIGPAQDQTAAAAAAPEDSRDGGKGQLDGVPIPGAERLVAAHLRPRARVQLGRFLAHNSFATALIDISDGLLSDLGHICRRSGVGAEVWEDRLPVSQALQGAAEALREGEREDPWSLALRGGEDYQLLFTVPPNKWPRCRASWEERTGERLHEVGRVVESKDLVVVDRRGARHSAKGGWDHFAP
jgi:thiamine-monophosphate kinase